jgi:hypothetical protein
MDLLKRRCCVSGMKQRLMRWAASPEEREAWFGQTGGVCPAPLQLLIKRPGRGDGALYRFSPTLGFRGSYSVVRPSWRKLSLEGGSATFYISSLSGN